ncbi:Phosphoribulokinase [Tritrichomonas foetus]|uniref:Phosphoribulokinase n=1 Tax=Tritrichomonas foetus TaxID=1144522 RepID=A0A1J4KJS5_9EUKA|nr:Phosphoribulokinase [Tritrichomonas foetus]|eukprot:OHT11559.1 Phosphoribulokinase [Tritrichomonas foetus]
MNTLSSGFITKMEPFPSTAHHDPRKEKITRTQLLSEHATLSFLLIAIYNKLFNRLLKVEHSLGDGYFCIDSEGEPISEEMTLKIDKEMHRVLNSPLEIKIVRINRTELEGFFTAHGFTDKLGLLKTWTDEMIPCVTIGDYVDYLLEPISTDKNRLRIFEVLTFNDGIVLRFPTLLNPTVIYDWQDPTALFDMFHENREWAELIGVDTVAKLNEIIYERNVDDVKWLAEGLHQQKLAKIAKYLVKHYDQKRIVTIAGPSSSNKTTFAKRLAIHLRVNGYDSTVISMDDFYKDRADIPFGEDGLQDFESITALNIDVLSDRVKRIMDGETVPGRHFDFVNGVGFDDENEQFTLPENSFLIIEGIHGLNPELLSSLGRDAVTPIYVSALTPVNLDFNHRFPTSDLRLIRRIIRDYNYRGYSPRKTISRWTSVRVGEERNIFPFQENAELFFNSALVYELPVYTIMGKALLAEATIPEPGEDPEDPRTQEITNEARRLYGLLNFFYPVPTEVVPHISCIREFVGGSDLKY